MIIKIPKTELKQEETLKKIMEEIKQNWYYTHIHVINKEDYINLLVVNAKTKKKDTKLKKGQGYQK